MSSPFPREATATTSTSNALLDSLASLLANNLSSNSTSRPLSQSLQHQGPPPRPSSTHSRSQRHPFAQFLSDLDTSDFEDDFANSADFDDWWSQISGHTGDFPSESYTSPYQNNNYNSSSFESSFNNSQTIPTASIDLTQDSDLHIMPVSRGTKRRSSALHSDPDEPSSSNPAKRRRFSNTRSNITNLPPAEHVDLSGEDVDLASVIHPSTAHHKIQSDQNPRANQGRSQQSASKSKLTSLQCTVCLESPTDLTATSCGHVFCRTCLLDWLVSAHKDPAGARRPNCPACRRDLRLHEQRTRKDFVPLVFMKKPVSERQDGKMRRQEDGKERK